MKLDFPAKNDLNINVDFWREKSNINFRYDDIMPLAQNCTEIYVWNTKSFTPGFHPLIPNLDKYPDSNLAKLTYQKPKSDVDNH